METQTPTIVCIAKIAQDMCGRCNRPLTKTGGKLNHFYAGDPTRATCATVHKGTFIPAPRFCMLTEEDHQTRSFPELVEALSQADWQRVPYGTNPFRVGREGIFILARAAAAVLENKPHRFKPGILCPTCKGERFYGNVVGYMPGLREGTQIPVISDKDVRCRTCAGIGIMKIRNSTKRKN